MGGTFKETIADHVGVYVEVDKYKDHVYYDAYHLSWLVVQEEPGLVWLVQLTPCSDSALNQTD